MSSFLFQKQQINCNCFDSSPKANRRIFRSESYHTGQNNNKQIKQMSARNQSQQGKHKKKSLKKQKQFSQPGSQKDPKQKEQTQNNVMIPELPINLGANQYKKQQKVINTQNFDTHKFLNIKPQKSKPIHNIRNFRAPESLISDFSITTPLIAHNDFRNNNLSMNSYPQSLEYINFTAVNNQKVLSKEKVSNQGGPISHRQYQHMIVKEFQQDLHQFRTYMQNKQRYDQNQKVLNSKKINFENKYKNQQDINRNQQDKKIAQNKQKQRIEDHIKLKSRKQSLSANKNQNYDQNTHRVVSAIQYERTPVRPSSFRGSTVSQKQKQSISKRIKGKMLPKQIQSQKDGSSSQSDQLSEVLGRGWDGLTQQRIELQQLDQMVKKEKLNSQTMVTQQSHIKNSEIKTLTDYSNSFTSPKSQYSKGFPFGGTHKYGVAGMSYHHIEQLGKARKNYNQKHLF